jgi:hypothetical protein
VQAVNIEVFLLVGAQAGALAQERRIRSGVNQEALRFPGPEALAAKPAHVVELDFVARTANWITVV